MGNLMGHIQPQPVNTEFLYPIFAGFRQIFRNLIIIGIQLWHKSREMEGIILFVVGPGIRLIKGPFIYHKPIPVSGFRAFFQNVLPIGKIIAAMIEYAVQHDSYTRFMGRIH